MNKTPEYQLNATKNHRARHKLKQYNRSVPEEFFDKLDELLEELREEYKNQKKGDKDINNK